MKHTICFIDDAIPVSQYGDYFNDTDIINESVIQFLIKQETAQWRDPIIHQLCNTLIKDKANWSISAFVNPTFYINYTLETVYAPDVVIYDWDYPGLQDATENTLLHILNSTPALIFVFSESENIEYIKSVLSAEKFIPFMNRLEVVDKNAKDSVDYILSQIQAKESANFAFAYGGQIIRKSNQIINKILSDISQLSTESFIAAIGKEENNRYISTTNDFINVIIPRYKNALNSVPGNDGDTIAIEKSRDIDIDEIKKIWSYKMYEKNDSNKVALGDIIRSGEDYYLVISSDCHMRYFWTKNGGYMAVIPLEKLINGEKNEQIKYIAEKNPSISSLTSCSKAMTILPAVPVNEQLMDFIVLPKKISTIKVEKRENSPQELTYDYMDGFEKIASISDPFKSPLFHFILNRISDLGCPDFPEVLQNHLSELIKQAR